MSQQFTQLRYGQQLYNIVPTKEPTFGHYSQNKDRQVMWGTYTGTNGVLGKAIPVAVLNTVDKDNRPLMMTSGPWWIDGNHAIDGDKYLSLAFYTFTRPVAGNEALFNMDLNYMLVDELKVSGRLQANDLKLHDAKFGFWVQCLCNKTGKYGNYFFKQDLNFALQYSETEFELNMSLTDIDKWEVLGTCPERADVYDTVSIQSLLDDHSVMSMGFVIYPYKVNHLFAEQRPSAATANIFPYFERGFSPDAWPVDTSTLPSGTIILRDLEMHYKKSHVLVAVEG